MHLIVITINLLNRAHYENDVGYNKKIIKKYRITKHLNCLLTEVKTRLLSHLSVLSCAVFSQDHDILLCMWFQLSFNFMKSKSKFCLYWLYYAEACNEFTGPNSASLRVSNALLLSKKCRSSGEPLATQSDLTGSRLDLPLQRQTRYRSTKWPKWNCNCIINKFAVLVSYSFKWHTVAMIWRWTHMYDILSLASMYLLKIFLN